MQGAGGQGLPSLWWQGDQLLVKKKGEHDFSPDGSF